MTDAQGGVLVGFADELEYLWLDRGNRHGVVAGATGTGKTVTLQILAQGFSDAGVPVFAADVKGDLSGIAMPGAPNDKMLARAKTMGIELKPAAPPVVFWDLFGQKGHPIRATVSEMGPTLVARLLELNDVQEGVLTIAFHVADQEGLLLLDLKDLQAALKYVVDHASEIGSQYGNVAPATVGTIQRKLLTLDTEGGGHLFGEPALKLADLMRTDSDGKGYVNILAADTLVQSPKVYSTFLLWLLSQLFEELPEVGDPDKPKLVFFFDEAHLLFSDAPPHLLEKIEQVVRLIRSKGVGVYFISQSPADMPDTVLAQLGNRVQHALRAYTPGEQKGLKAAADSFRANPKFNTAETIQALGVGEALVSLLDEKGAPTVVAKTLIRPPASRLGPITAGERTDIMAVSPVVGVYDTTLDRESAFEVLQARTAQAQAQAAAHAQVDAAEKAAAQQYRQPAAPRAPAAPRPSGRQTMVETFAKSLLRTVASQAGREIMRGILGSISHPVVGRAVPSRTYASIQSLRAGAALAVVVYHAFQWLEGGFEVGRAGVDVFFVISGFIMWTVTAEGEPAPGVFLWRRVTRVVPLYWLASVAVALTAVAWPAFLPQVHPSWSHLALSLGFIPHNDPAGLPFPMLPPGWTLNYEAVFYLIFACALLARPAARLLIITVALAVISLFGFIVPPAYGLGANPMMLEFAAGAAVGALTSARRLPSVGVGIALAGLGVVAFAAMQVLNIFSDLWWPLLMGVPATMLVAGAVSIETRRTIRPWPPLAALGDASYSIYLWHLPATAIVAHTVGTHPAWLFVPLGVAASTAAGLASHRWLERPLIRALRRLGSHRPALSAA